MVEKWDIIPLKKGESSMTNAIKNGRMLKRVSAMLLAVFLCVSLFAGFPTKVNAALSDLYFGGNLTSPSVGDEDDYFLGIRNAAGEADFKKLVESKVTATFSVEDPSVVKIVYMPPDMYYSLPYCRVTYLKAESTKITMKLSNGLVFETTTPIPYNPFWEMWFTKTSYSVKIGDSVKLEWDYKGKYGAKPITNPDMLDRLVWEVSDSSIATVSKDGVVTGKKSGVVTVYLKLPGFFPNRDVKDYIISCQVAVSADGKATVPTTTKKVTQPVKTTSRPGTTTKVTQATKKNTNTTQSTAKKTDTAVTHVAGVSSTGVAQTTIHTTTTENYKTDLETTTSGTEETSTTGAPAYGESKSQSNGPILLAAVIIVILGGGASIFILVRKTRSR